MPLPTSLVWSPLLTANGHESASRYESVTPRPGADVEVEMSSVARLARPEYLGEWMPWARGGGERRQSSTDYKESL